MLAQADAQAARRQNAISRASTSCTPRASRPTRSSTAFARRCARARSNRDAAQAQLGMAERGARDSSVRAPFAGLIARRYVSEGEFVSAGAEALRPRRTRPDRGGVHVAGARFEPRRARPAGRGARCSVSGRGVPCRSRGDRAHHRSDDAHAAREGAHGQSGRTLASGPLRARRSRRRGARERRDDSRGSRPPARRRLGGLPRGGRRTGGAPQHRGRRDPRRAHRSARGTRGRATRWWCAARISWSTARPCRCATPPVRRSP